MNFKDDRIKDQFQKLPLALKDIAKFMDEWLTKEGKELIVTRAFDPVEGESGVHLNYRAFDARVETSEGFYIPLSMAFKLKDLVNNTFKRRDKFTVCVVHSFNDGPYHFHVQIPAIWSDYNKFPNKEGK